MNRITVEEISRLVPLPPGFRFDLPSRSDIPEIIAALRAWFPNVEVGAASCFLRPGFYTKRVHLSNRSATSSEADYLVVLARKGDELVAIYGGHVAADTRIATARLAAIAPRYRGLQLGTVALLLAEAVGRAMGADLALFMATMHMPHMQAAAEQLGWTLVGIIPGSDLEMVHPGEVRRVYEAMYVRVLCAPEMLHRVEPANMTAATLALYRQLFGEP